VALTDFQRAFFKLLQEEHPGEWFSRSDIAKLRGKKRLNPYEIGVLDLMAERGLIQRREVEIGGPIGYQYQYRGLPVEP